MSALRKEAPEIPAPFCPVRTQQEGTVFEPGGLPSPKADSAGTLILDFPVPTTVRNQHLLCISHLVYGIFVAAARLE